MASSIDASHVRPQTQHFLPLPRSEHPSSTPNITLRLCPAPITPPRPSPVAHPHPTPTTPHAAREVPRLTPHLTPHLACGTLGCRQRCFMCRTRGIGGPRRAETLWRRKWTTSCTRCCSQHQRHKVPREAARVTPPRAEDNSVVSCLTCSSGVRAFT
eukprot:3679497-Rhodomonas_salina.1